MNRPNILWIVTTQWRGQALGYAGDPNARTPHLDRLAAESVNFTQAVTPHPFGPFARAATLTGVLSPENGVRDYFDPLPTAARTIAHELRERGYTTAFFGKWHLAKREQHASLVGDTHARIIVPLEARGGFEFWEGFESGFLLNDPWLHGTRLSEAVQFKGYQADVLVARAKEWIEELRITDCGLRIGKPEGGKPQVADSKDGRGQGSASSIRNRTPWFVVASLESPHPPYDALAAGIKPRDPREIALPANVPRGGEIEAQARRELSGYYAQIEATDRAIGALLEASRIGDLADKNTVIVFTSVHGDMHGAHGLFRKGWPHEESVRVPLLIRGQGSENGRIDETAVSLVDLPRMTLAWTGQSTWGSTRATFAPISMPSVVALQHQCDRVWRGVRSKTRKLVLNSDGSPWLFFDLERDPLEKNNLVGTAAYASELAELKRQVR